MNSKIAGETGIGLPANNDSTEVVRKKRTTNRKPKEKELPTPEIVLITPNETINRLTQMIQKMEHMIEQFSVYGAGTSLFASVDTVIKKHFDAANSWTTVITRSFMSVFLGIGGGILGAFLYSWINH